MSTIIITGLCGGAQDLTDTVRQHRGAGHERSNYCWNQVHVPLRHGPSGERQERNLRCPLHQNCSGWVRDPSQSESSPSCQLVILNNHSQLDIILQRTLVFCNEQQIDCSQHWLLWLWLFCQIFQMFTETLLHLHLITKVINWLLYINKKDRASEISFQIPTEAIKQIDYIYRSCTAVSQPCPTPTSVSATPPAWWSDPPSPYKIPLRLSCHVCPAVWLHHS